MVVRFLSSRNSKAQIFYFYQTYSVENWNWFKLVQKINKYILIELKNVNYLTTNLFSLFAQILKHIRFVIRFYKKIVKSLVGDILHFKILHFKIDFLIELFFLKKGEIMKSIIAQKCWKKKMNNDKILIITKGNRTTPVASCTAKNNILIWSFNEL